jgi:hypothetical protein
MIGTMTGTMIATTAATMGAAITTAAAVDLDPQLNVADSTGPTQKVRTLVLSASE